MLQLFKQLINRFKSSQDLHSLIDQRVVIKGTAQNAKAGALIMTSNQQPIYLAGRHRWDQSQLGQHVTVEGVLRLGDFYPQDDPIDGQHVQGMSGEVLFIENYQLS